MRTRAVLVVTELTLALVLLAGAGLMGRSLLAALRTSAGMRLERTLLINLSLSDARYPDAARTAEFYRRVLEAVGAVPGVEGTALTTTAPFGWAMDFNFLRPGQAANSPEAAKQFANYDAVNPDFFRTLEIRMLQGRAFDARDAAGMPPVAVVNEAFARRFLSPGGVLGQKIITGKGVALEIVGVAGRRPTRRPGSGRASAAVRSLPATPRRLRRAARSRRGCAECRELEAAGRTSDLADRSRPADRQGDHVGAGRCREHHVHAALRRALWHVRRLDPGLAALGIYGTVSYSVGQRTREIGIRMALGAQRGDVLRLVLGQGTRLILAGLGLGIVVSLALARLVASLLYGVDAHDPATLGLVATLLGTVALLASYLPARRATRIDPLAALREE